ncbi:General stress protein 26 [Flavobacteriaceae bacterium MAR_2010_188]|nr:General stress protein 26 [Flavobacteriaceae bacterium MAR_2010_188]
MGIDNLYNKEAKDKIRDLAKDIDFCMMATNLSNIPFHAIPMSTKKVDEQGNVWFLSGRESDHNKNIQKDSQTQLIYSDASDMKFMKLYGHSTITDDKSILKDLYGKTDDNWFDGLDDPSLTAIKFAPKEAHYWEPKHGKFISLIKMGIGAITGNQPDISEEGHIKP